MIINRYRLMVKGIVQGVGFRPFIHGLAESLFLCGWVNNTGDGVIIEVEGGRNELDEFIARIRSKAPQLSYISDIEVEKLPPAGYSIFEIKPSMPGTGRNTYISPDVTICGDCTRELFDKSNQRYLYPFINCTNCGPRFTIIKDVPYDRPNTTMSEFDMCEECKMQYQNILDRRYHAQPVACSSCGPKLWAADKAGNILDEQEPINFVCSRIAEGKIAAIKGIGGYHLSCNAYDSEAVNELRKRKHRDERPFALMVRDLNTARKHCFIDMWEEALLCSPARPIVLMKRKPDCSLTENLSAGNPYLGIMLPYTPVHHLMFNRPDCPDTLVMTSGNISSEPISYKDSEAFRQLGGIADYYLGNNREIHIRTDDSVTRIVEGQEYIIRRSRGYVPRPVSINRDVLELPVRSVLACGGELKNTFCLSKNNDFYLSHYIGDLENLQTLKSFEDGIEHFKKLFDIKPEIIAYDLHPRYLSTKYALELDTTEKLAVQHHHAHIAACMAENNIIGDVIGVAFDGTGYGEDGNIWGGEFFSGTYGRFTREAHLGYVRLPGGEAAVREPLRMALSYLHGTGQDLYEALDLIVSRFEKKNKLKIFDRVNVSIISQLIERGLNSPYTSSMGRLFDAVSATAGICPYSSYEGQAAIELEYAAQAGSYGIYEYGMVENGSMLEIDAGSIVRDVFEDVRDNTAKGVISTRFHDTIADMILRVCLVIGEKTGSGRVVLSGGVFQNMLLVAKCTARLQERGFRVYTHSKVPANDGGISLGQAVIAASICRG